MMITTGDMAERKKAVLPVSNHWQGIFLNGMTKNTEESLRVTNSS
jgi:hypothetical protein